MKDDRPPAASPKAYAPMRTSPPTSANQMHARRAMQRMGQRAPAWVMRLGTFERSDDHRIVAKSAPAHRQRRSAAQSIAGGRRMRLMKQ
jgi:hypothetical protein